MIDAMTTTQATPTWTLGERLAKARRWAGLSPDEMATALGRSPRSIRNYEHDTGNVPLRVLRQYAARTGVPLIWLIEGDEGGDSDLESTVTGGYLANNRPMMAA